MFENSTVLGVSKFDAEAVATIKEFEKAADQHRWYERPSDVSVLPEELFNSRATLGVRYPETALLCAVLEDALDCFQKQFISGTQRAKRSGEEAEEWFFSDDLNWAFSFLSICTALDLGPEYIRRGLEAWRGRRQDRSRKKRPHVVRVQHRLRPKVTTKYRGGKNEGQASAGHYRSQFDRVIARSSFEDLVRIMKERQS